MNNQYTASLDDACKALARAMQASKLEQKKSKIYKKGETLLVVRRLIA